MNSADTHELLFESALSHLPHGPEFRFLDRLRELNPGKKGLGEYTVRGDESFLKGHFPGNPLLPGVLIIEAAAQLAGVVAQSDPSLAPLQELKLTALRNVKIFGSAEPGQVLELKVEISGRLGPLIQASTEAKVCDLVVMKAEITLSGRLPGPGAG